MNLSDFPIKEKLANIVLSSGTSQERINKLRELLSTKEDWWRMTKDKDINYPITCMYCKKRNCYINLRGKIYCPDCMKEGGYLIWLIKHL